MIETGSVEFVFGDRDPLGSAAFAAGAASQGGSPAAQAATVAGIQRALARLEASFRATERVGNGGNPLGRAEVEAARQAAKHPPSPGSVWVASGKHRTEVDSPASPFAVAHPKLRKGKIMQSYAFWPNRDMSAGGGKSPMRALGIAKGIVTGNVRAVVGKYTRAVGGFYAGAYVGGYALEAAARVIKATRQGGAAAGAYSVASGLVSPIADIAGSAASALTDAVGDPRTELQMQAGLERVATGIFGPFANPYINANRERRAAWVREKEAANLETYTKALDTSANRMFGEAFTATWNEKLRTGFTSDPGNKLAARMSELIGNAKNGATAIITQRAKAQAYHDARIEEMNGGVLTSGSEGTK